MTNTYFEHQRYHEWYGTVCGKRSCPYFEESPRVKFLVATISAALCWVPLGVLGYLMYRWSN